MFLGWILVEDILPNLCLGWSQRQFLGFDDQLPLIFLLILLLVENKATLDGFYCWHKAFLKLSIDVHGGLLRYYLKWASFDRAKRFCGEMVNRVGKDVVPLWKFWILLVLWAIMQQMKRQAKVFLVVCEDHGIIDLVEGVRVEILLVLHKVKVRL